MSSESLVDKMNALREKYYSTETKNVFVRKSEKDACAQNIASQIPIEDLTAQSFFALPNNPSHFFMNYPVMKMYVNSDNYMDVCDTLIAKLRETIVGSSDFSERNGSSNFPQITIHVNLDGFTVSAAERYLYIFDYFSTKCIAENILLTPHVSRFVIYHTPAAMNPIMSVLKFFIEDEIMSRLEYVKKGEESLTALNSSPFV